MAYHGNVSAETANLLQLVFVCKLHIDIIDYRRPTAYSLIVSILESVKAACRTLAVHLLCFSMAQLYGVGLPT